ncbi:MAG: DUF192 domain-containing protein [Planctomycetota bacterium]|jgi:uncharacterized membrane protein (UPF0127 family)
MRTGFLALLLLAACSGSDGGQQPPGSDLSGFETARISINGTEIEVWLAKTAAQQQQGLMLATADQLDPLPDGTLRGMLFIFPTERFLSFWMRNTWVPLDLAYARSDGVIAETHALVPLDETLVPSGEPVRFALEVFSGTLAAEGIGVGDLIVIPPEALD